MKKLALWALVLGVSAFGYGQGGDQPHVSKTATLKLMTLPVVPACAEFTSVEGDPMKGGATIFFKTKTGCEIPWHWHTASERLIMVSGKAKLEMKDHPAETFTAGDYALLTSKGIHQFTCLSSCVFYDITDAAFDIHYVKADGTEIPAEEALKAANKPKAPAKKAAAAPKG
ncbi:MAG TPA: cupin domain-containing protein [Candidatus Koribacter sp.]|jgi:quercetin dioxygenase-like cupin family protein